MTDVRDAPRKRLTDQKLIDLIALAEPEYRGLGMWLSTPDRLDEMRGALIDLVAPLADERRETPTTHEKSECGVMEPQTGYTCELAPGHGGDHRAFIDASDEEGQLPERRWSQVDGIRPDDWKRHVAQAHAGTLPTELWLCGQIRGARWEFQGIFTDRARAETACLTKQFFIYPVALNKEYDRENVKVAPIFPRAGTR